MGVTQIGSCKGCDKRSRLDDGVCAVCLEDPARGRAWAVRAHRCRTDPAFAASTYRLIGSDRGKAVFIKMFGLPSGEKDPAAPRLALVEPD